MIYYSFYTDWQKKNLFFRTKSGFSPTDVDVLLFNDEQEAFADFAKLLWDNEDYRMGEYFNTEKKKVKREDKPVNQNLKVSKTYTDIEVNKTYNEDCMETMKRMPNDFIDITITSPPYNVGNRSGIGDDMYNEYVDDLNQQQYESWIFGVIDELLRVTRKHIFFNIQMLGNNKLTVLEILGRYKRKIKDIIIWNKTVAPPHISPGVMNSKFEFIIIFSNQNPHMKKFMDGNFQGNFNNVIEGSNASKNKYAKLNKATFPSYLPRIILNMFGDKDDLIYDPFAGTGTTQEACIIEGRRFIGSEIDEVQCNVINDRVKNESSKLRLHF